MILLITAVDLGRRANWSWKRLILIALAGTIPFLSFVAERSATKDVRAKLAAAAADGRLDAERAGSGNAPLTLDQRQSSLFVDICLGGRPDLGHDAIADRRPSANSMVILPLTLPRSTRTRVSRWSDS